MNNNNNLNALQKSVNTNPSRGMTGHGERGGPGVITSNEPNQFGSGMLSKEKAERIEREQREGSMDNMSQNYLG